MHLLLAALLAMAALFDLVLGFSFMVNPALAGGDFGLLADPGVADGAKGLSALRGDMSAFFITAAFFMGWAAWQRRSDVLLPALALYGIAFIGRTVNLIAVGPFDGWIVPALIEGGHLIVIALGLRAWPIARAR